jgi:putative membrane protein
MSPAVRAIFTDWEPDWFFTGTVLLFAVVYLRGWLAIRKTRATLFPDWRLVSFLLGVLVLWSSVASPLDGFADVLLSAHMTQHLLLMSVVPPLLLLGAPVVPLLRGSPRGFTRVVLGPVFRSQWLLQIGRFLTKPVVAWLAMNVTFLLWHTPAAYDFALYHENWHKFEHLCFLGTSLLFWWPVIQPWPAKFHDYRWGMLVYLLTADFINTALSAFLAFCDRPVYTYYLSQPNPFHADPVGDQVLGAALMWVIGSIAFLLPAMVITVRLLQGKRISAGAINSGR